MNLNSGNYFLDLGVDDFVSGYTVSSISQHCDLIHLVIFNKYFLMEVLI